MDKNMRVLSRVIIARNSQVNPLPLKFFKMTNHLANRLGKLEKKGKIKIKGEWGKKDEEK